MADAIWLRFCWFAAPKELPPFFAPQIPQRLSQTRKRPVTALHLSATFKHVVQHTQAALVGSIATQYFKCFALGLVPHFGCRVWRQGSHYRFRLPEVLINCGLLRLLLVGQAPWGRQPGIHV